MGYSFFHFSLTEVDHVPPYVPVRPRHCPQIPARSPLQTRHLPSLSRYPILILNIFAHNAKVLLLNYDVHGDKTNEPGCLKSHLEELFQHSPMLRLLGK